MQKKEDLEQKRKKFRVVLIVLGIFTLIFSTVTIIYSLTFLIKKINLISESPVKPKRELQFNLKEAQKLFPQVKEEKESGIQ